MIKRIDIENREYEILSPLAFKVKESKGRAIDEEKCEFRTDFQRDRDRIVHSKAFRRLIHKTQVFLSPEGDHYRTRLTHTLEVAQVSRTVARILAYNEDLTEAIALGHDLGHTPFGHVGEAVLNKIHPGGFVHSQQSLRTVDVIEDTSRRRGLNLTFEVRDGILNHSSSGSPATREGQIVQICDRIAYVNHDIDDAIRGGIIKGHDIPERITDVIGHSLTERINTMIHGVVTYSGGKDDIVMNPEIEEAMLDLRSFLFENVYTNPAAKAQEVQAENLVTYLYEYYMSHIDKLPEEYLAMISDREEPEERVVCDYIAGMTDRFAVNKLKDLFIPSQWDVM